MENITIGTTKFNVCDIIYHKVGVVFKVTTQFSNLNASMLDFHGVQFTIIEWYYDPITMITNIICTKNAGYKYNPYNNIIEESILKALKDKRPIYGLADEIQEDIEEKQWLSQMRYLL